MSAFRFVLVIALAPLVASGQQASSQQASPQPESVRASPITRRPAKVFVPPAPYQCELPDNVFLLGTEKLWTDLSEPMVWLWAPHQPGHEQEAQPLTAKIFWWRVGYDYRADMQPHLTIIGKRLDGPAPPLMIMTWQRPDGTTAQATNAIMGSLSAMLTGVYVPTPGCWEITGEYRGDQLSFVVWVEPLKRRSL